MYNKYHNQKTTVDGIPFDSKKEARRYQELKLLERTGQISDLKRQVEYELIPEQREPSNIVFKKGKSKGKLKPGKLLEQKCSYVADFTYIEDGFVIVEDVKGIKTDVYKMKRKLMLQIYRIQIRET